MAGDCAGLVTTTVLVAAGRAVPPNYAPHAPSVQLTGRVMTIYGGLGKVGEAGDHSIVTINRTLQRLRATGAADFRDGTLTAKDCTP